MVAMEPASKEDERSNAPVVLSHGASVALSSAVSRLLKPERRQSEGRGKRPRASSGPVVLAENEEVAEHAAAEQDARRRDREAKRARLRFENNAKVIPDAATNAVREKELLATATRGAVALFNAVARAQRAAKEERAKSKFAKKKGAPVSKESFMSMIRAGVAAEKAAAADADEGAQEGGDEAQKAGWLKDDYLTSRSRKLKDWDKAEDGAQQDSDDEEVSEDSSDGGNDDSESGEISDDADTKSGAKETGNDDGGHDEDEDDSDSE